MTYEHDQSSREKNYNPEITQHVRMITQRLQSTQFTREEGAWKLLFHSNDKQIAEQTEK